MNNMRTPIRALGLRAIKPNEKRMNVILPIGRQGKDRKKKIKKQVRNQRSLYREENQSSLFPARRRKGRMRFSRASNGPKNFWKFRVRS